MTGQASRLALAVLPELILLGGAVVMALSPWLGRRRREASGQMRGEGVRPAAVGALAVVTLAIIAMFAVFAQPSGPLVRTEQLASPPSELAELTSLRPANGSPAIRLDGAAQAARWAGLLLGFVLVGAAANLPESSRNPSSRPGREPTFFALLLLSLAGLMLTAVAHDLVLLLLSVELTCVPAVAAVAMSRPSARSADATRKSFVLGAVSAGLLAMGLTYVYGVIGQTNLDVSVGPDGFSRLLPSRPGPPAVAALVATGLVLAGLASRLSAFPGHLFVGDLYDGSAHPVSAWLSLAPKLAGLLALAKILTVLGVWSAVGGWQDEPVWQATVWALAAATMTAGNVLALRERNLKRLLAYGSVAQTGFLLMALLAAPASSDFWLPAVALFYFVAYGLANAGAFASVSMVGRSDNKAAALADLRGLGRRRPWLAVALALFALSLTGVPPAVGFQAKRYILVGAYQWGFGWLAAIGLVNVLAGGWVYLRIPWACWRPAEAGEPGPSPADQDAAAAVTAPAGRSAPGLVIAAMAAATLAFGLYPAGVYNCLKIPTQAGQAEPTDAEPEAAPNSHCEPGPSLMCPPA